MIRAMVATRLDWPVSRDLLNRNYSLFIVTQCWTDQLRLKGMLMFRMNLILNSHRSA